MEASAYEKEFFLSVDGWVKLLRLVGLVWSLYMAVFLVGIGLYSKNAPIPQSYVMFALTLSVFASIGSVAFLWVSNHPNKWVRWAVYIPLILLPIWMYVF